MFFISFCGTHWAHFAVFSLGINLTLAQFIHVRRTIENHAHTSELSWQEGAHIWFGGRENTGNTVFKVANNHFISLFICLHFQFQRETFIKAKLF